MDDFGGEINHSYNTKTDQRAADRALPVQFYYKDILNPRTEEVVRREYVKIWIDQWNIRDQAVRFDFDQSKPNRPDPERWPEEYAKFKAGEEQVSGVPINQIPVLTPSEFEQIKSTGFKNASQIALLPDNQLYRLGIEGLKLREKVKNYLDAVNGDGHKLALQNKELERRMAEQEEQNKELLNRLRSLESSLVEKQTTKKNKPTKQSQEEVSI